MLTDIQKELDIAEEYVLTKLFGSVEQPIISPKIQLILTAKNINFDEYINLKINIFENVVKDFMKENGYLDGEKVSKVLALNFSFMQGITLPDMRLKELIKAVENFVPLEKLGELIQNL